MKLNAKVCIVTGGNRGIGFAIAKCYLEEGATVVVADIRQPSTEISELATDNHRLIYHQTDVSNSLSIQNMVDTVISAFGRIDVLVNNAGIEFAKTVIDTTEAEWDALMGVNLKGVFLVSKACLPHMIKSGSGVLVNVASELGVVGEANVAAYCASKGGVIMLTKAMAIDHGQHGIRINALCPGPIETELLNEVFQSCDDPQGLRESFEERIILNRLGHPQEIAKAALFLASDDSSFMTGADLIVDGGWTTW